MNVQRHTLWIALAIGAIYFAPSLIRSAQQAAASIPSFNHISTQAPGILPNAPASAANNQPPASSNATGPLSPGRISGFWKGAAFVANRGRCQVAIEITPPAAPTLTYPAAITLQCVPLMVPYIGRAAPPPVAFNELIPVSANMIGTVQGQSVHFAIDKNLAGTCPLSDASVTPFGTKQLAIQWKDNCGNGELILAR